MYIFLKNIFGLRLVECADVEPTGGPTVLKIPTKCQEVGLDVSFLLKGKGFMFRYL